MISALTRPMFGSEKHASAGDLALYANISYDANELALPDFRETPQWPPTLPDTSGSIQSTKARHGMHLLILTRAIMPSISSLTTRVYRVLLTRGPSGSSTIAASVCPE